MLNVRADHSFEQWQEAGRQAADALVAQRRAFLFWKRSAAKSTRALQAFLDLVCSTDPSQFTEEQFLRAEEILNTVITATQKYLTTNVDYRDAAQFCFLGEAIRQLRDARHWIIQGYSPSHPPTPAELSELDRKASAEALSVLFPSKQPELR